MLRDLFFDIGRLGAPTEVQLIPWVLAVIWSVFLLEQIGMLRMPRVDVRGDIITIITANLGHESFKHILVNSIGAALLLWLYLINTPDPWLGLAVMYLGSTGLFWLFGTSDNRNGRGLSYFLFALNGWLIVWLYTERLQQPEYWALLVATVFSSFKGAIPGDHNRGIAWSAHLSGLIVGLAWSLYYFGYLDRWTASYR